MKNKNNIERQALAHAEQNLTNTNNEDGMLPAASCSHPVDSDRPIPDGYSPCCLDEDKAVWQFIWNNDPSDDLIVKTV
jgi:hypothetical protein